MRKLIVAILSLSSLMLHAQASTPAQTQVASNGSAPQVKRISTGVIAPKLIYKVDVVADSTGTARLLDNDCKVVVGMVVDKNGKPSDLKILKSAGAGVDASVLTAVSQYRFTPGMVSNQPTATPLNLEVVISNSYR
jgi:TonB family protein